MSEAALAGLPASKPEFRLALQSFEGPLDLLLHLITRDKVDVFEIRIADITDQYLEFIRLAEEFDIDLASEFLVMASTLVDIKASSLLPREEEDEEDDDEPSSADDARLALVDALIEYKAFKNIAREFEARLELEQRFYTRHALRSEAFAVERNLLDGVEPDDLAQLYLMARARTTPRVLSIAHMKGVQHTVEDKIVFIQEVLSRTRRSTFRQLTKACTSRVERIVVLLALLELHKEGKIELRQAVTFGEIEVLQAGRRPAVR